MHSPRRSVEADFRGNLAEWSVSAKCSRSRLPFHLLDMNDIVLHDTQHLYAI